MFAGLPRSLLLSLGALFCVCVAACDEDEPIVPPPPPPPVFATFEGRLVDANDGSPADSVEVSLFRLDDFRMVDLTRSDLDGRFTFDGIDTGDYLPVVRSSVWDVLFMPETRWSLAAGDTARAEIRLRSIAPLVPYPYTIHGRVLDDATREPIPGVMVEMTSAPLYDIFGTWSLFDGHAHGLEVVSDQDGYFDLGPFDEVPGFLVPEPQTASWRLTHPDYFDVSMRGYKPFQVPDSVTVFMGRGVDFGVIVGRVTDPTGTPVEDVPVVADWRRGSNSPVKGLTSASAASRTRADGRFRIEGLAPGFYNVRCAAFNDDDWVDVGSVSMQTGVEVVASADSVETQDLITIPNLDVISPLPNEIVHTPPVLQWEEVPFADTYILEFLRGNGNGYRSIRTSETSFDTGTDSYFSAEFLYFWKVTATFGENLTLLASTERRLAWKHEPLEPPVEAP